jgi:hypothetical protein
MIVTNHGYDMAKYYRVVRKYFATSFTNIHVAKKMLIIFHGMAWNMF